MSKVRADGRAADQLRDLKIELGVQKWAEGSAVISIGNTVVICSASVEERVRTRDHTEIALKEFGAELEVIGKTVRLQGGAKLTGRELVVPGDLSSACFFLVAALLMKEADLVIHGVGLNPTRSALLDFLVGMGAQIRVVNVQQIGGELIDDGRRKRRFGCEILAHESTSAAARVSSLVVSRSATACRCQRSRLLPRTIRSRRPSMTRG